MNAAPILSLKVTARAKHWQFPRDPFVTYEPADEVWCRTYGFGREVDSEHTVDFPCTTMTFGQDGTVSFRPLASLVDVQTFFQGAYAVHVRL